MASTSATNPDTLVALKVNVDGSNRRFKLPLRDLGASTLPEKLRFLLAVPPTSEAIFERYSDSAAAFVVLDPNNASVYKQLYRAAKAKLKLRLKVTISHKEPITPKPATVEDEEISPVSPVDAESVHATYLPPIPSSPAAEPTRTNYSEAALGSVAEIQRGLEELLINQPRFYSKFDNKFATGSGMASPRPVWSDCSSRARAATSSLSDNQELPSLEPPNVDAEVPVMAASATARDTWYAELASVSQARQMAVSAHHSVFSVYCNHCGDAIPDEHHHCSTCDDGDYDLCQKCVNDGVTCNNGEHWMIKRFVKNGMVINSTTETIAPKLKALFSESKTTLVAEEPKIAATRTCNSCIEELTERNFVTCTSCADFDLCITCHVLAQHGHHPKHAFTPAVEDTKLNQIAKALLAPGRNVGHNAMCDGCDKYIYGVRHKCLDCPDWDYCSECMPNAHFIHQQHRFVPIYEPLNDLAALSRAYRSKARHIGIYCDGPLCNNSNAAQTYIEGDRYKCAVCHDTDFCAGCEASPSNVHNKTHPLIKFRTPVRNVSVTTLGDHEDGKPMPVMGDRRCTRQTHKATETTQPPSANAATQVQTVADLEPTEPVKTEEAHEVEAPKSPEPALVYEFDPKKVLPLPGAAPVAEPTPELVAHFVRDVIADGTILPPNCVFEQTWYLRNGGTTSWPAGCSVKFVGGDNMCAVDPAHPASVHELVSAAESTTCYTEVAPGQEVGFTVLMRTPPREGNFISYWRLTGPHGDKFGHRLWCDVSVNEPVQAVKEEPKEEVKEELSEAVAEPKAETEGSQMIFPKLEKESPASSIHQEVPVAAPVQDEADDFEDFVDEDLADEETDDGFMTDEEYDILDASDEEYLAEQAKVSKK